jgi:ubiquinone biosynthesis protein UbiJ
MLDPAPARGIDVRIGFRIGEETFLARLAKGRIEVRRNGLHNADVVFTGTAPAIAAAVYGGQPLRALEAQGALKIEGDRRLANRFVKLFPLPPKVEASA